MNPHRRFRFSLRALFVVVTVAGFSPLLAEVVLPPFLATNCGGNSAALSYCHTYATVLRMWIEGHPNQTFDLADVDPQVRQELTSITGEPWVRGTLLARATNIRAEPAGPREVVVVCARAYDNVPQRVFLKAPMTHAVGYSTGEAGLINRAEFAKLDLSDFIDLRTGNAPTQ